MRFPATRAQPAHRGFDRERLLAQAQRLNLALLLIIAAGFGFIVWYSRRITDWIVMTDELLYAKLSLSIADTLSPLPTVRDEPISLSSQLYPLLTAPIYALFDMPSAFHGVHIANAAILASAAVPAYLLARDVLRWQTGAYLAAAFSLAIPWLVLGSYGLTEVAAYPAFLWAVLAIQRATVEPTLRGDLLAVAAIVVAALARTQFFVLAPALPVVIALHEVGYRWAIAGKRSEAWEGLRSAVDSHRVLAVLTGIAGLLALVLAAVGSLDRLLGPYAVTATEGSLLPRGVWRLAAAHLDAVAIATGILPFVVAAGWALSTVVRPASRRGHAYAISLVVVVILLTLQVSSFEVRFGDGAVRDRYLFYIAPLLFVGMLACLRDDRARPVAVAAAAVISALLVRWADLGPPPGFWEFHAVDRPASVLNGFITDRAEELGLGATTLVEGVTLLLGLAVAGAVAALRRPALVYVLAGAVLLFCVVETRHAFERLEGGMSPSGRPIAAESAPAHDWIDRALPDGAGAGLLPYPVAGTWGPSAVAWWDAEFWNKTVQRAFVVREETFSYTPETFPRQELKLDFQSGRLDSSHEPSYLVLASREVRLRPRGATVAARGALRLVRAERPYSAEWATDGLWLDGWTLPGTAATVRLFARPGEAGSLWNLSVALSAIGANEPRRYSLRSGESQVAGELPPGTTRVVRLRACVPAGASADVLLDVTPAGLVPGMPTGHGAELNLRAAGLQLTGIETVRTGRDC